MNPDPAEPLTKPAPAPPRKRHFATRVFALLLLAGVAVLLGTLITPKRPALIWLPGKPLQTVSKPSTWGKIRLQMIKMSYPVWRYFRKSGPNISLKGELFRLSPAMSASLIEVLGHPLSSKDNGLRAWIATAEQARILRGNLDEHSGGDLFEGDAHLVETCRVLTSSGRKAMVFMGATRAPEQFIVEFSPTVVGKRIRLEVGRQWVRTGTPLVPGAKCRALLPNGGALIIEGTAIQSNKPQSCLLIFGATAVDAAGNPRKL